MTGHIQHSQSVYNSPKISLQSFYWITLFLSALHGRGEWFDSSSSALLWGAFERDRCVFAGEWPVYVPLAGPGLLSWCHPEPLQCALHGPPQFRYGQRHQHHTQNHMQAVSTIISEVWVNCWIALSLKWFRSEKLNAIKTGIYILIELASNRCNILFIVLKYIKFF